MHTDTNPRPEPGYAFIARRALHPREPETIVIDARWCDAARFHGTTTIDGTRCNRWRTTDPDTGRRCVIFQTRFGD